MKTYKKTTHKITENILIKTVCNKCTKEIDVENGESHLELDYIFGYGTKYDSTIFKLDLCEICLIKICKLCKIPPNKYHL